jgi:hypothetical protein
VVFMNSLTAVSLARWSTATGRELGGKIAVAVLEDMIENGMSPWGEPYYKELPSLKRVAAGTVLVELAAHVCMLTGETKYLRPLLPALENLLSGGVGTAKAKTPMRDGMFLDPRLMVPSGKSVAMTLPAVLQFIAVSGSEKLARSIDYSLEL